MAMSKRHIDVLKIVRISWVRFLAMKEVNSVVEIIC